MANDPFFYVILIACAVVAVILLLGVGNFGRGGDPKTSNKLMRYRIGAQFVAVILIVAFAYFRVNGGN